MKNNKLPWMPFYGRDFFNDDNVKTLRMAQAGFYVYLLWHQWEHGFVPEFEECLHFPFVGNELYWAHQDGYEQGPAEELSTINQLRYVFKMFFVPHPTLKKCFINLRCAAVKDEQVKERLRKQAGGKTRASQMWGSTPTNSATNTPTNTPISTPRGELESESEKEKKKTLKSVSHGLKDRSTKGFEQAGESLSDVFKKIADTLPS